MNARRRTVRGRACLVSILAIALIAVIVGAVLLFAGLATFTKVVITQKGGPGVEHAGTLEKTLPAAGITSLKVNVRAGEIKVFTDGGDTLRLTAERKVKESTAAEAKRSLDKTSVEFTVSGSEAVLKDVVPETWPWKGPHNVTLVVELHVPANLAATLDIGVGSIAAEGDYKSLSANSGAGSVAVNGVRCAGDLTAHTGAGGIKATGLAFSAGRAVLSSGAGEIEAGFAALPPGGVDANSGVGSVSVLIPPAANATISMETSVGEATSDFPGLQSDGGVVGKHLSGDLNGGGPKVSVHASTGAVRLKQLPAGR